MHVATHPTPSQMAFHKAHLARHELQTIAGQMHVKKTILALPKPKIRRDWILLGKTPVQWRSITKGVIIYNSYPGPFLASKKFLGDKIIKEVCDKHDLTECQIKSKQRSQFIVKGRNEICYRIHRELGWSLPQIGRQVGGRDHTTILHSIRRHTALLSTLSTTGE